MIHESTVKLSDELVLDAVCRELYSNWYRIRV